MNIMRITNCLKSALVLLTLFIAMGSSAQLQDSLKAQFVKDWVRSKAFTDEYLATMPKDKYGFRAQDSIRTFAQQMLHLAQGTVGLMSSATGKKMPDLMNRGLENSPTAKDSVAYFVDFSYDYAIEALKEFDINKAFERVQRGRFDETRLAFLLKAYEHQAHHRGQATIYIRLLGIKPPNEKLF
jgi:uncharacterized damage-inducible protein DinB